MLQKLEFYILSLFFLFLLIFISKVPFCSGGGCDFIGIKSLFVEHLIVVICFLFMALGGVLYAKFVYIYEDGATLLPAKVKSVENINYESVTFLSTYIVPLACMDMDKSRSPWMLITILILIGWIYIKTNLFYTNPTLAIWGYQIFRISTDTKNDITVLSRKKIDVGDTLDLKIIDDNIYLAKVRK